MPLNDRGMEIIRAIDTLHRSSEVRELLSEHGLGEDLDFLWDLMNTSYRDCPEFWESFWVGQHPS